MKKVISYFVLMLVLGSLLLVQHPQSGYAQGQGTPSATPFPGEADFITFSMLNLQDEVMNGPYASTFIRFSTPDSWLLLSDAKLRLNLETTVNTSRIFADVADDYSGAILEVSMNGQYLQTIFLLKGVQEVEINIPPGALIPNREDGRHSIQLFLNATIDCLYDHETTVFVRSTSGMNLPHKAVSPQLDLTLLPRPLYKLDSLLPPPAIIVVPDAPTGSELQAAMTVAASLGRMSNGEMAVNLVNVGAVTDLQKASANLIVVGNQASLPILQTIKFSSSKLDTILQPGDGVAQVGISPWNLENVVYYIGGDGDEAVVKAAQAFSSGALRVGVDRTFAVIANVTDSIKVESVEVDRTFAMLGYPTRTLSGAGFQSLEYSFMIPFGKIPSADSTLTLIYNHSAIMDFNASGAVVFINDEPFSSIRFTTDSAKTTTTLTVDIPEYSFVTGKNSLVVQVEFIPTDYCSTLNDTGLWLTVREESMLHIPLVDAESGVFVSTTDLGIYPSPFINDPTLSDLAFVFSASDPLSWHLGATIAADLGQYATGSIIEVMAADAADIPAAVRDNANLILVGRASELPIIQDLTDSLPAPFKAGSDVALEDGAQITYRIPPGTDLGYLELVPAPWNTSRSILAVLGSTPTGLEWAGNALANPSLRSQLLGNYVVATEQKLYAIDTTIGLGTQNLSATAVPDSYPTMIVEQAPLTANAYKQDWVVTAIIVTSSTIGLFLLVLAVVSMRRRSIGNAIRKQK